MIRITYSDGSVVECPSLETAESEIDDRVIGSNFDVTVETVEDNNGNILFCEWQGVKLIGRAIDKM